MLTLKAHTDQEAFDLVIRHLAFQPRRSVDEYGNCVYVAPPDNLLPDGKRNRCAAGALIDAPDDELLALLEESDTNSGIGWHGMVEGQYGPGLIEAGAVSTNLVSSLQDLHDTSSNWVDDGFANWTDAYAIAERFGVDPGVVMEVS